MRWSHLSESPLSFFDPLWTRDKSAQKVPYRPERYKQIVLECYYISRNINTSYNDILEISPRERELLRDYVREEQENTNKQLKDVLNNKERGKK